jgi:O-antigen ligase
MILIMLTMAILVLTFLIAVRPYWGVLLLWPVLLFYPHALMQDVLPFNIGFDDLYVAFVFIVTLVHRLARGEFRFGKWGLFTLAFWLLIVLSSFYGTAYENIGAVGVGVVVKDVIKRSTIIMVAVIMLNGIDDFDQLLRAARWFFIGAIGLSILAILQFLYPQVVAPFYQMEKIAPGAEVWRATGTTRGPWEIGGVLGITIVLCVSFLAISRGVLSRFIPLICAILSVVAIILSGSRSGWTLVAVGVFTVFIFSKRPIVATVAVISVASVIVVSPLLVEMIMTRMGRTVTTAGALSESATMRFTIWKETLSNITIGSTIVGLGRVGAFVRYEYSAHSSYVAALVETGIVGICYFILLGVSLWRRTWSHIRLEQNPAMMALWKGIFSANVGVLFYGLTNEAQDMDLVVKTLFFFWSFLYLRDYITIDYNYEFYGEPSYEHEKAMEPEEVYEH